MVTFFPPLLLQGFLTPEVRDLRKLSYSGLSVPQVSNSLHSVWWLFLTCCRRKLRWWWLSTDLWVTMSLQVILVLHILEQYYLVFLYDFGLSLLWFLAIQTVLDMGFILRSGPLVKSDTGWLLPHNFCHLCISLSCRPDTIVDPRVCRWFGVHISTLAVCRAHSYTKDSSM